MKSKIIDMYFKEQKKPVEIAKELQIPKYTVTRVLQKDNRYLKEKQRRIKINKLKHTEKTKTYIYGQRSEQQFKDKNDELVLKKLQSQASRELSLNKRLSNMAYRNWNKSAYTFNEEKERFEFRDELGRSRDVPKYIKINKL